MVPHFLQWQKLPSGLDFEVISPLQLGHSIVYIPDSSVLILSIKINYEFRVHIHIS